MKSFILSSFILLLVGCAPSSSQQPAQMQLQDFSGYWYAGEAEISSYQLVQARYGEIHSGEAVLVFVTEPFSRSKQVKLDNWRDESEDKVGVMKLNMTKKFLTGIYPYSMMMSTFVPADQQGSPTALKVTTSSQEWCGHTWMQLNQDSSDYRLRGFSYFESEGDVDQGIPDVILEDQLWTQIRLNPNELPTGKRTILPATFYLRLKHRKNEPQPAELKIVEVPQSNYSDDPHKMYAIEFADRSLTIYFEENFPHTILGWEETYISGFGNPEKLTTKAKRINTIQSAYWGKNSNADRVIRKQLGLSID